MRRRLAILKHPRLGRSSSPGLTAQWAPQPFPVKALRAPVDVGGQEVLGDGARVRPVYEQHPAVGDGQAQAPQDAANAVACGAWRCLSGGEQEQGRGREGIGIGMRGVIGAAAVVVMCKYCTRKNSCRWSLVAVHCGLRHGHALACRQSLQAAGSRPGPGLTEASCPLPHHCPVLRTCPLQGRT